MLKWVGVPPRVLPWWQGSGVLPGSSVCHCSATRSISISPPQHGHTCANRASTMRSACAGASRCAWRPRAPPRLRPGRRGSSSGSPLENRAAWRLPPRRDSPNSFSNSAVRASRAAITATSSAGPRAPRTGRPPAHSPPPRALSDRYHHTPREAPRYLRTFETSSPSTDRRFNVHSAIRAATAWPVCTLLTFPLLGARLKATSLPLRVRRSVQV